jgi:16S rRNA (adenine1518-N6/adenine1519-N6)-dimethyltransferase
MVFRPAREDVGDLRIFERLVRGIFLQRRKTLLNALKPVADSFGRSSTQLIAAAGVDGAKRPQELTLRDIAQLSRAVL